MESWVVRPGGTIDNSPAIYRWVTRANHISSPGGTTEGDVAVSHSYASCLYHCVWSMKQRQRIIIPELRERLWPYIGGIAQAESHESTRDRRS